MTTTAYKNTPELQEDLLRAALIAEPGSQSRENLVRAAGFASGDETTDTVSEELQLEIEAIEARIIQTAQYDLDALNPAAFLARSVMLKVLESNRATREDQ